MNEATDVTSPHGWVWLDNDAWEHNPSAQHPQERGEAEYGEQFRPATAEEASSPDFFRCPVVHCFLEADYTTFVPTQCGTWVKVDVMKSVAPAEEADAT